MRWASFADRVGPSLLPFLIRPDRLDAVSFKALGMMGVRVSSKGIPDFDKLEKAYMAYCEKERKGQ